MTSGSWRFLKQDTIALTIKENIDKFVFVKVKNFCPKENIKALTIEQNVNKWQLF